jgi:hypothetical protein
VTSLLHTRYIIVLIPIVHNHIVVLVYHSQIQKLSSWRGIANIQIIRRKQIWRVCTTQLLAFSNFWNRLQIARIVDAVSRHTTSSLCTDWLGLVDRVSISDRGPSICYPEGRATGRWNWSLIFIVAKFKMREVLPYALALRQPPNFLCLYISVFVIIYRSATVIDSLYEYYVGRIPQLQCPT